MSRFLQFEGFGISARFLPLVLTAIAGCIVYRKALCRSRAWETLASGSIRIGVVLPAILLAWAPCAFASAVHVYPAIPSEPLSATYSVGVVGNPGSGSYNSPVYNATVEEFVGYGTNLPKGGTAAFTNFTFSGTPTVTITLLTGNITSITVLPASKGITASFSGNTASFVVPSAGQYDVEINNEQTNSLQIFANSDSEADILTGSQIPAMSSWGTLITNYWNPTTNPNPFNSSVVNLIYYGPTGSFPNTSNTYLHGYQPVGTVNVPANTMVYIDGGAAVYGQPVTNASCQPPNDGDACPPPCASLPPCSTDMWSAGGCTNKSTTTCVSPGNVFNLTGANIYMVGRGIIDGSGLDRVGGDGILLAKGTSNLYVEGPTFRDSGGWTFQLEQSKNATITNIKEFGWRLNSDGVDIDSTQTATLSNSYLRTFDDLVAIKTNNSETSDPDGTTSNVTVEDMVLWNEKAHAFTVGTEIRQNVTTVLFSQSDIIRDTGHDWLLSVDNGEAGTVSGVTFDNIRIQQVEGLMTLTMPWAVGNADPNPGNINNITFSNITSPTPPSSVPQPNCSQTSDTCTAGTPRSSNPPATLTAYGPYNDINYEINTVNFTADTVGGSYLTSGQVTSNPPYVTGVSITN